MPERDPFVYGTREERQGDPLFARRDELRADLCADLRATYADVQVSTKQGRQATADLPDQALIDRFRPHILEDPRYAQLQTIYGRLVDKHWPLATRISGFFGRGLQLDEGLAEDLMSEVKFGLYRACELYDTTKEQTDGIVFSDYAGMAIANRCRRFALQTHKERREQLGKAADVAEDEFLQSNRIAPPVDSASEFIGNYDTLVQMAGLTARQRFVLEEIFIHGMTGREVAKKLRLSDQSVSQMKMAALIKLRALPQSAFFTD